MSSKAQPRPMIGIGVVGMGLMGRTHLAAYRDAIEAGQPARVVALADREPNFDAHGRPMRVRPGEDKQALFDPGAVDFLTDPGELFARPGIQLVSICTHTDSHVELAIAALRAGKSVLLEKPVALRSSEIERLIQVADQAPGFCMPAMCMRFWPGWSWLKDAVETGVYGRVLSASFRRLASRPDWAPEFYGDHAKSGGALFDLHIHDADLVRWLFGEPEQVHSSGDLNHMTSTYGFEQGPAHVSAEGGWDHAPGFPFQMHFSISFERASAEFSSLRDPPLLLYQDGGVQTPQLDCGFTTGYDGEVRHALEVCRGAELQVSLQDSLALTRMLEVESSSLSKA